MHDNCALGGDAFSSLTSFIWSFSETLGCQVILELRSNFRSFGSRNKRFCTFFTREWQDLFRMMARRRSALEIIFRELFEVWSSGESFNKALTPGAFKAAFLQFFCCYNNFVARQIPKRELNVYRNSSNKSSEPRSGVKRIPRRWSNSLFPLRKVLYFPADCIAIPRIFLNNNSSTTSRN